MTLEPTTPANTLDPITTNPMPARASVCHVITIEPDGSIGTYYVRQHDTCKCVNRWGNAHRSVLVTGHGVHQRWDVGETYPVSFQPNCYTLTAQRFSAEDDCGEPRATNGKLHVSAPPQDDPPVG